jgi:hypothetical protein
MAGVVASSLYEPAFEFMFPRNARSVNVEDFWRMVRPYAVGLLSAVVIAIVVLAFSKAANIEMLTWWQSFLVGFGINKGLDIFNEFRRAKAQS